MIVEHVFLERTFENRTDFPYTESTNSQKLSKRCFKEKSWNPSPDQAQQIRYEKGSYGIKIKLFESNHPQRRIIQKSQARTKSSSF